MPDPEFGATETPAGRRSKRPPGSWRPAGPKAARNDALAAGCQRKRDSAWVTVLASKPAGSNCAASSSPSHSSMSSCSGWAGSHPTGVSERVDNEPSMILGATMTLRRIELWIGSLAGDLT